MSDPVGAEELAEILDRQDLRPDTELLILAGGGLFAVLDVRIDEQSGDVTLIAGERP